MLPEFLKFSVADILQDDAAKRTARTNVQQAGLDVKSLQYLMGHSNASVTLDVYTQSSFDSVERTFEQIASSL